MLTLQKGGGYGAVRAAPVSIVTDVLRPTQTTGLIGTAGVGSITWAWDQSCDVDQASLSAIGVAAYKLEIDGALPITVTAPAANTLELPSLINIGTSGASSSQNGNQRTLIGASSGIDKTSDSLQALSWDRSDSFRVRCKVSSFTGAGFEYAYAGIMVRETTAVGSKYAALYQWLSANNKGVQAKKRPVTSAGISSSGSANGDGNPTWLQIVRNGDQITYQYSSNGGNWIDIKTETVAMNAAVKVLLFCSDLVDAPALPATLTAVFDEFSIVPYAPVTYVQSTTGTSTARVKAVDANGYETDFSPAQSQTAATAPGGGAAMKFRPGAYMWSSLQSYRPITDPVIRDHHIARLAAIASNPYIKGIQINTEWAGWEGDVKGNFTSPARSGHLSVYEAHKSILDYAASIHKCVMLSLTPLHFGNYGAKNYMFPAYLFNSAGSGTTYDTYGVPRQEDGFGPGGIYGLTPLVGPVDLPGGGTGTGFRGITAKIWQDPTADAANDVMTWHGATFDSHPALELIVYSESALNVLPGFNDDGYSNAELRRQVYRLYTHARACFPTTLIRSCLNDFGYDTPHMRDMLAFCFANQIIPGGPSVRRDDVTQADRVYVGLDDYGNHTFTDYRGKMPWCPEVQDPEEALWTATQLRDASNLGYTASRWKKRLPGDPEFTQNGAPYVMESVQGVYFIWPDQEYPTKCQWTRDVLPLINSTQGQTYWGNPTTSTPAFSEFFVNGTNRAAP